MNTTYTTRPAGLADSAEIAAMQRSLAEYCGYDMDHFAIDEQRVAAVIEEERQAQFFVAEADKDIAGMMLCNRIPMGWRGVSGVYVEDLFVKPAYRHGSGIGKLLIARACHLALELAGNEPDAAFVRLDTGINDNDDTLRFYRRLGMSEDNINFRLYGRAVATLATNRF